MPATTIPGRSISYTSGARGESLHLAYDELRIAAGHPDGDEAGLRTLLPTLRTVEAPAEAGYLLLTLDAATADEECWKDAVAALRRAGHQPVAVCYATARDARGAGNRQFLLRQFSVKAAEGEDIAALARDFKFRTVEEVTYSPRTWIAEPESTDPLAGLETANLLAASGRAEFATPLIERTRHPRPE